MSNQIDPFDDIRAMLRDIAASQRKSELLREKTDEEIAAFRKEADERKKEADERKKEADERKKEADERKKEADERSKALDKQIAEISVQIGGIGNKFGHYTEALILPSMDRVLHERFGVELERIATRERRRNGDRMMELDCFGYKNGIINTAYVVEVKDIVKERHVEQMLKILADFPDFFTEHADKHLYGIIAAIEAPSDVQRMMANAGLYYADITNNIFELVSPPDFVGKDFRRLP
jgi:Protein of unknown function (DUF3782)